MRLALGIEYNGQSFAGWETQVGQPTVQAVLETALGKVADKPIRVICAGRTDAGVHATGQVAHFDTDVTRPPRAWTLGTNGFAHPHVSVLWAREVPEAFHARFTARCRHYRYLILNRRCRPGLLQGRVAWVRSPLDAAAMHQAAQYLLGEHDFSSLQAAGCQAKSPVRTVHAIKVERHGDFITIDVSANAFLQHMVRNLAGTLCLVGAAKRPPAWLRSLLLARDRTQAGMTMAPDGLYFIGVEYPSSYKLASLSSGPMLW